MRNIPYYTVHTTWIKHCEQKFIRIIEDTYIPFANLLFLKSINIWTKYWDQQIYFKK